MLSEGSPSRSRLGTALFAAALLFAAIVPTLSKLEFSRTLENLNVATALEARRDGHWFQPTLEGLPRTVKPPLLAWITALSMRPDTVAQCGSTDATTRDAAFHSLAFQARWPTLLMSCLTVIAVYALGACVGDAKLGAAAAVIAAGSYGLLRYAQASMTDVPLTLWVTVANACFAAAAYRGKRWGGMIGAGLAIGLAFMSKGPIVLLLTVVPWGLWCAWRCIVDGRKPAEEKQNWLGPILIGALLVLAIALPWYVAMLAKNPTAQWQTWRSELSGEDAAPDRGEPLPTYLWVIWELMFPWVIFLAGGLWLAFRDLFNRPRVNDAAPSRWRSGMALLLLVVLVTLIAMTFRKEKKDRYLLPTIGPMAVIAARCALAYFAERPREARRDWVGVVHWLIVGVVALALPIVGLTTLPDRFPGVPRFTPAYATGVIVAAAACLALGVASHLRRNGGLMLLATTLVMLVTVHAFAHVYPDTEAGRADMKPLADALWQRYPDADGYSTQPFGIRAATDFSIYRDRPTGWMTMADVERAAPGPRPKVVLIKQRKNEPMPAPPAPWFLFDSSRKGDGSTWHAFVLPAAAH